MDDASPESRINQLEADVARFEETGELSHEDFSRYWDAECEFEQYLYKAATTAAAELNYSSAGEILDQIIVLNRTLVQKTQSELDRDPSAPDNYRKDLHSWHAAAQGMVLLLEGQKRTWYSEEQKLSGNIDDALVLLAQAAEYLRDLSSSNYPTQSLGALRYAVTEANGSYLRALAELRVGNYQSGAAALNESISMMDFLIEDAESELAGDNEEPSRIEEIRRELVELRTCSLAAQQMADFYRHSQVGNFGEAAEYMRDAVTGFEALVNIALEQSLSRQLITMRQIDLEHSRGWLQWCQAEKAIDDEDWPRCQQLVTSARLCWNKVSRLAIKAQLFGVRPGQLDRGHLDMLLYGTLRRCEKERSYRQEIGTLREQFRRSNSVRVYAEGGRAMQSSDSFNFQGPVNAGAIGTQSHGEVGSMTAHATGTAPSVDLAALAKQLESLTEVMRSSAASDVEMAAASEVAQAHQAAAEHDERSAMQHLRAAGRWALTMAQSLALPIAEAVIQKSIGS